MKCLVSHGVAIYSLLLYMDKPYIYSSTDELNEYLQRADKETFDTLYRNVKSIWSKYIDADDFHLSICSADTIFSYLQDRIGLTHYLFFIGSNTSGKSNNLTVLHYLGYRNFTSTDMSAANIYTFLGSLEDGQGTICEDEADDIDTDREKMRIHKNGYTTGFPTARTDLSTGRKQYKYNTFGFRAFAAEKLPDSVRGRGFNQCIIELQCTFGLPQYSAGEVTFQKLLDELNDTRKLLLTYRLIHYHDRIPDIKLNIINREKQLFKPVLRVFQNTETLKELLSVVSKYIAEKW
jgi:hypothetical protein